MGRGVGAQFSAAQLECTGYKIRRVAGGVSERVGREEIGVGEMFVQECMVATFSNPTYRQRGREGPTQLCAKKHSMLTHAHGVKCHRV